MEELDQKLLLMLNGSDSLFLDKVMLHATGTLTWIPVLIALLYVILKNKTGKDAIFTILAIALTILICDQVSSSIIKPLVCRFRPSHEAALMYKIRLITGRGGFYGFLSSHAANTFGVATLLSLLLRNRTTTLFLFIWCTLCSYSRIYLGLHYPGDILCGALLGTTIGLLVYWLHIYISSRFATTQKFYSSAYTSTGYHMPDIYFLQSVFLITFLYVLF